MKRFRRALSNYGDLGNFYDFAAGYRDLDLDPFDVYSAEPAQESVIDQITDAFGQGTDALGNLLSGFAIPEDMTIECFLDWIKENVPETTPTDIFEQVLGQGVGIIFDGSGVITLFLILHKGVSLFPDYRAFLCRLALPS